MPAPPPSVSWAMRVAPVVALLPLLAGCGPGRNQFAPACPQPAFLAEAADLDRFGSPGRGDPTDLVVNARMTVVSGACSPGSAKNTLNVSLSVGMEVTRGPAMAGRETDLVYFVAVTEGDAILDKHLYRTLVAFPPNVDRVNWSSDELGVVLPVSVSKSGAAYTILVGFQLTPDQLAANRLRRER